MKIPSGFQIQTTDGQSAPVSDKRAAVASQIDTNHDGVCDDTEIETYMRAHRLIKGGSAHADVPRLVDSYKTWLEDKPVPQAESYHTYDAMVGELRQLAQDHPDIAQLTSLGKSTEGRGLVALKISTGAAGDTSNKPAVIFDGCHHAREWNSMEVPMYLAHELVEKYGTDAAMKNRVDNAEIWVVPMVNPDGYEYSRTQDSWWRKTRSPITDTECPVPGGGGQVTAKDGEPVAWGVDPNRNYFDGNPDHMYLYRQPDDKPCDTSDDFGASDYPDADDYRGPHPASEPEVRAMMQLEYTHPNVRGIIDHHSYGEQLLRPWGHTMDDPPDVKEYDEVAARMRAAQSNPYTYEAGRTTYPTCGSSENSHEINGIKNFTIEMGREFQTPPEELPELRANVGAADFAFLDWIIEKNPAQPLPAPAPPTA